MGRIPNDSNQKHWHVSVYGMTIRVNDNLFIPRDAVVAWHTSVGTIDKQ